MKCVNAYWELRNLGVKTIEILVEREDMSLTPDELIDKIEVYRLQYDAGYVVVKVDTRYTTISLPLQRAGFWLIENQIGLQLTHETVISVIEEYKELFADVSYRPATDDDMQMLFAELNRGMFRTDRVALDPHFGVDIANRRYALWIKDAISQGAGVSISLYDGTPFGFGMGKLQTPKKSSGLLGGIFNRDESRNYGAMNIYAGYLSMAAGNVMIDKTFVSSNNVDVLRLHLAFGRKVTDIKNVFVKHYNHNIEVNRGGVLDLYNIVVLMLLALIKIFRRGVYHSAAMGGFLL